MPTVPAASAFFNLPLVYANAWTILTWLTIKIKRNFFDLVHPDLPQYQANYKDRIRTFLTGSPRNLLEIVHLVQKLFS